MTVIPTKNFIGDVAVSRNVTTGGKLNVRGSATVDHNLRVKGWLEAPNIKAAHKGLFLNIEKLNEAYPQPEVGWWALIGDTVPAQVCIADGGVWLPQFNDDGTPKLAGNPTTDNTIYDEEVELLISELESFKLEVANSVNNLHEAKGKPNGFASLDPDGKVPQEQLPETPEIPEQRVIPFGGVLIGRAPLVTVGVASGNGTVMFVEATNCFVFRKGGGASVTYYANWEGAELYGAEIYTAGRTPYTGRLYVSDTKEVYIWGDNKFASITAPLSAALGGMSLRVISPEEDEAMTQAGTHDPDTLYFITEEQ